MEATRRKIAFHTLGCRLNQAETAALQNRFAAAGYEIVGMNEGADVVVINTCTVTEHGDSDTRRLVQKVHSRQSQAHIALIGCQSQTQGEALRRLPGVSWVVGNASKMELPEIIRSHPPAAPEGAPAGTSRAPAAAASLILDRISRAPFTMPAAAIDRAHTRANLKIQDGCDFMCAFCEIPFARGRSRSRDYDDLLQEAAVLAAAGHRELVLTGVNIGTWRQEARTLMDVLRALHEVPGVARLRISSIEMTTVPAELFELFAGGRLCRFLHIPAQSGSDAILKAMRRRHDAAAFAAVIEGAAARVPDICLGTDILAGFPGESDAHFDETYSLLESLPLAYFHVFSYSDRGHAASRRMADKVSDEVKARRSKALRQLSLAKRHAYFARFLGRVEEVLFEEEKRGIWSGLTDTFIRVQVHSREPLHNQLRRVRLERIEELAMAGALVQD